MTDDLQNYFLSSSMDMDKVFEADPYEEGSPDAQKDSHHIWLQKVGCHTTKVKQVCQSLMRLIIPVVGLTIHFKQNVPNSQNGSFKGYSMLAG